MRYASVCSGVGTCRLSWGPLGWETVFFAEVEPFPCEVLRQKFGATKPLRPLDPAASTSAADLKMRESWLKQINAMPEGGTIPNLGDFTKIKGEEYRGTIDLLAGGTPCQDFSLAGLRAGLDGDKGNLSLEFARLVYEIRPRWFVWENVPGVFSSNKGEDFRAVLSAMAGYEIERPGKRWRNSGIIADRPGCYGLAWRVLDAQYVRVDSFPGAVPQRRKRVFVVGYLGNWRPAAAVLFDRASLQGHPAPRRKAGAGVARSVTASVGGSSGKEQQHTFVDGDGRPLNALSIQGEIADGRRQNQNGLGINADGAAHTINTASVNAVCYENHMQDSRVKELGDVAPTLAAKAGTGGGNLPMVMTTGQCNAEIVSDHAPTLNCNHEAPIVMSFGWNKSSAQSMNVTRDATDPLKAARCSEPAVVIVGVETGPGWWNKTEIAGTLRAEGENRPSRPSHIICNESGPGFWKEDHISGTVKVNGLEPTTVIGVTGEVAHTLKGEAFDGSEDGTGRGTPIVAFKAGQGSKAGSLGTSTKVSPTLGAAESGSNRTPSISYDTVVRRLTPLECERLMGYPDFHTLILWGAPKKIDFARQMEKVSPAGNHDYRDDYLYLRGRGFDHYSAATLAFCPDSPRYKACGNSWAVNCIRWIGMRIQMVEAELTRRAE